MPRTERNRRQPLLASARNSGAQTAQLPQPLNHIVTRRAINNINTAMHQMAHINMHRTPHMRSNGVSGMHLPNPHTRRRTPTEGQWISSTTTHQERRRQGITSPAEEPRTDPPTSTTSTITTQPTTDGTLVHQSVEMTAAGDQI